MHLISAFGSRTMSISVSFRLDNLVYKCRQQILVLLELHKETLSRKTKVEGEEEDGAEGGEVRG